MPDEPKKVKLVKSDNDAAADTIVTSAIGRQLKNLYDEFSREPVPDRFAELIEQLAKQEREKDQ